MMTTTMQPMTVSTSVPSVTMSSSRIPSTGGDINIGLVVGVPLAVLVIITASALLLITIVVLIM